MFRNKFQVKRMQNEQVMRILVLKWEADLGFTVAYGATVSYGESWGFISAVRQFKAAVGLLGATVSYGSHRSLRWRADANV
ncbi:hypothetical protein HanHA300_Chr05g0192191 [Helianthus annuus]|nr:hypothetical protein HanHA300_Chr05g0192191 [Helianthus annuus]KAJ0586023.1 hypothetical protein HanHA89_Chr05g0207311 [Helianthus annuus]KAJ0748487.1 hypothetical protein HanOQP8_Chr05g0201711 [Helianthus annuus]